MRQSFKWITVLFLAFAVAGCPKKKDDASSDDDSEKDSKKSKKKKGGGDDDDDGDKDGKKKKGGGDDDGDKKKKKSADGPFAANFEGNDLKFAYGKAYAGFSGLHVTLSTEKTTCKYAPPSDEAYQVEFDIPPGPGQKFFAGHPIGVSATFNSQRIKLKQTWAHPYQVSLNVEPFKLKEGEHVKGSLDFDVKYIETKADTSKKEWKYKGAGSFDVEICEDYNNFKKLPGLADSAGDDDLGGEFGGDKFKYKTALANVWHDKANDVDYIESIEFYPGDDVTCSSRWEQWKKVDYFILRSIGGASSAQKFTGTTQPADPSFSQPKPAPGGKGMMGSTKWFGGGGGRRAWVKFDKLEFKGGGTVSGVAFAESGSEAKPDETGKIGGKFSAKVCSSGF